MLDTVIIFNADPDGTGWGNHVSVNIEIMSEGFAHSALVKQGLLFAFLHVPPVRQNICPSDAKDKNVNVIHFIKYPFNLRVILQGFQKAVINVIG